MECRKKGRINVMGALRFSDKKRRIEFLPKSNGDNFYLVLKNFYDEVKYEWAGEDKNIDEF